MQVADADIRALAEALAPGASIVAALRSQQPELFGLWRADLDREFQMLGQIAGASAVAHDGLVVESRASFSQKVRDRVASIIGAMNIPSWVELRLKPLYETHYKRTAELTFELLRREGIKSSLRDAIERSIIEAGGKRVGLLDIAGDTRAALFDVVEQSRDEGLSPIKTAKLIQDYVPRGRFVNAGSRYRSQLIARTEALHAQRLSSIESYKATGEIRGVVAFDGDGDEECAARNGSVFTFDEAEVEMDLTHPNCVLCFAPAWT